jgi:hypothetical protein
MHPDAHRWLRLRLASRLGQQNQPGKKDQTRHKHAQAKVDFILRFHSQTSLLFGFLLREAVFARTLTL